MNITHDVSSSQEGCETVVTGALLYFNPKWSKLCNYIILYSILISGSKKVWVSSLFNYRALRYSHRKYAIGKQTISKFIFNLVLHFKKYFRKKILYGNGGL